MFAVRADEEERMLDARSAVLVQEVDLPQALVALEIEAPESLVPCTRVRGEGDERLGSPAVGATDEEQAPIRNCADLLGAGP